MSKKMLETTACLDDLNYCRLSEVKRAIERAIDHYGPDASFKVEGQDFDLDFLVIYEREETDSEEKDRLDLEARMKERRKLQYEQLKEELVMSDSEAFGLAVFTVFAATALCLGFNLDRILNLGEIERAKALCVNNGNLKVVSRDMSDFEVTCQDGAKFFYTVKEDYERSKKQ